MKSKKIIIFFLCILIICICIIFATLFFLTKNNIDGNNVENLNNSSSDIENYLTERNILNREIYENQTEYDFNSTGTDWIDDSDSSVIEEIVRNAEVNVVDEVQEESWSEKVTQEDLDNYNFQVSYENMSEEVLGYINKSFENFDETLKEYVYKNGFAAASKASYESCRTINSGHSIIIEFALNDYYANIIKVIINLENYNTYIENYNTYIENY